VLQQHDLFFFWFYSLCNFVVNKVTKRIKPKKQIMLLQHCKKLLLPAPGYNRREGTISGRVTLVRSSLGLSVT